MRISPKFAIAALLALDIVGNQAHVTSWTVRHTISGVSTVVHAAAHGIRDAVNSWTTGFSPSGDAHTAPPEQLNGPPPPRLLFIGVQGITKPP